VQATIDELVGAIDNFAVSQPINLIDRSWLAVPSNYLELIIVLKTLFHKALSEYSIVNNIKLDLDIKGYNSCVATINS
jgi:hypothetical protein